MKPIPPTPHSEVNELLAVLLPRVQSILGDQFVGLYLFGSMANGGFDRHSDVDILVATDRPVSDDAFAALQSMHAEIARADNGYADQLEVSYVPRDALRRHDPQNNRHPHLDRGSGETLHIVPHDSDWVVQRHILRERGITLVGPEARTLIDPVSAGDLRRAMHPILFDWYAHFLQKPVPFDSRGYQSYAVLSLCRILYTLETGQVVSKQSAAEWAKQALDPRWRPLIDRALLGRQNPGLEPEPQDVRETREMIRYALDLQRRDPQDRDTP